MSHLTPLETLPRSSHQLSSSFPNDKHQELSLSEKLTAITSLITVGIVLTVIVFAPSVYRWDESYYIRTFDLLEKNGLSRQFLQEFPGPAGPTYTIIHWILSPLTGLGPTGIRLVSFFCLVVVLISYHRFVSYFFQSLPLKNKNTWITTLSLTAVPMLITGAGLGMTDVMALALYLGHLAILFSTVNSTNSVHIIAKITLSALCLSLTILSRQTYALALLLDFFLFISLYGPKAWCFFGAYFVCTSALPIWVFSVWGGIVPPTTASFARHLLVENMLFSFAYGGAVFFLYDVGWLTRHLKYHLPVIIGSIATNFWLSGIEMTPLRTSISAALKLIAPQLLNYYPYLAGGLLIGIAICFMGYLILEFWKNRTQRDYIFLYLTSLLFLAAPLAINNAFSPRYLLAAVPALHILAEKNVGTDHWRPLRITVGCLLGIITLIQILYGFQKPL